jgi:enamine deaminase RidA (YjgF/YER057c/UK114 family)
LPFHQLACSPSAAQIAWAGPHSDNVIPEDAAGQARAIFTSIEGLLRSQASSPADLIFLRVYAVGRDALAGFNEARDEVYDKWYPDGNGHYPAATVLLVAGLAKEELLVEVEGSFVCREIVKIDAPTETTETEKAMEKADA